MFVVILPLTVILGRQSITGSPPIRNQQEWGRLQLAPTRVINTIPLGHEFKQLITAIDRTMAIASAKKPRARMKARSTSSSRLVGTWVSLSWLQRLPSLCAERAATVTWRVPVHGQADADSEPIPAGPVQVSTRRIVLWVVLVVALVAVLWVLILPRLILGLACDREEDRQVLDAQTDFYCPVGNKVSYDAWGECGLKKECLDSKSGANDGSKFAARGGRLQSKALYSQGKRAGGWTEYDREGKAKAGSCGYQAPLESAARH